MLDILLVAAALYVQPFAIGIGFILAPLMLIDTAAASRPVPQPQNRQEWIAVVRAEIYGRLRPIGQTAAAHLDSPKSVSIRLSVLRDGRIEGAQIVTSSGVPQIDAELLGLLHRRRMLTPMPAKWPR
ncbi:TonB C-terminal domain-containing protein [Paracoccus laeviglucosivorans]|uniref:TonB family C-terminal domain-containing protein n=1 Tax=Paracoccus laeviglucosivorans TaxID=1197861 RepID=A0A521F6F6_9RHOB|nr:TonB C-terminal domain-containing protein [Paracoccus laeviglucosivorans]SMO91676.1 TonB family C-terminal domain-containing protein [Paracoccus laeviglucosivorans]